MWGKPTTSLRIKLIDRLLPAMLLLLLVGAFAAYWIALRSATKAYDRGLLDTAYTIALQLQLVDGRPQLPLDTQARRVLLTDKYDRIFHAVYDARGELLDGVAGLPMPQHESWRTRAGEARSYYDGSIGGEPIRLAALQTQVGGHAITIVAGETLVKRRELVQDILYGMIVPEMLLILVASGVIWFGIRSGLHPLERLRTELARRSQADLQPIPLDIPEEVQPVAHELNALLARLNHTLAAQRNFVSDAAHQLRTPIAALQAQVEAARQTQQDGQPPDLDGILAASKRLSHLVAQLLALARAEPSLDQQMAVDLPGLVQRQAETWLPRAIARHIDLGFELAPASVAGNELLLEELLANLLDNALRHTPEHGTITVACGVSDGLAWLQVDDSGPGILPSERERVFERFYRPAGQKSDGCGLGLAIVRQIARQHGGCVSAGQSAACGGAALRLTLPVLAA